MGAPKCDPRQHRPVRYEAWLTHGLERLRDAAASGVLSSLCRRYGVSLLVVFGSVLRETGIPRDVDIAVRFASENPDVLGFLDGLGEVAGTSQLDLMNLALAGLLPGSGQWSAECRLSRIRRARSRGRNSPR